eukprot:TRINITY_DN1113_c0_g1_i1.p1 TRINITY_DN1113_c0_g1~~TRINITY_DN1113_c0_g1_i1.p1  ORF type:complete len:114 (-),score=15.29 TRINITY_DN1113_c0_g1_i1:700-1041(-)
MVLLLNVCSYLNREHASCSEEHQLFYRASGILQSQCFTGFVLDKDDRSITRSDLYFKELFNQCGLHIWKIKDQKGFPKELFGVKMYVLTIDLPKRVDGSRKKMKSYKPAVIKS